MKAKFRECVICGEDKRTTNTEEPFIGGECLRTKGRDLLLSDMYTEDFTKKVVHKPSAIRGLVIVVIIIIILSVLLGKFVF